jgi:deoxyadenosine/deoxycytidine kinase
MPKIISIEGNIGAGKTTILSKLEDKYYCDTNVIFIKEPVDVWERVCDSTGENILQKFYQNPAKYAFPFQVLAYITRYSAIANAVKENPDCRIIVCERSLDADYNIFAKMLFDDGVIDEICYQIYKKIYSEYADMFPVSGIVYIDADADVCAKRIEKRARDGEAGIQLDYLEKCKKYHDEWLITDTKNAKKLLRIKTNEDDVSGDLGNKWIKWISDFIDED